MVHEQKRRPSAKKVSLLTTKIVKIAPKQIQATTPKMLLTRTIMTQTDTLAPPVPPADPHPLPAYYCHEPFQRKEEMVENKGPISDSVPQQKKAEKNVIKMGEGIMKNILTKHEVDFEK